MVWNPIDIHQTIVPEPSLGARLTNSWWRAVIGVGKETHEAGIRKLMELWGLNGGRTLNE
jgi:hypothetical protein